MEVTPEEAEEMRDAARSLKKLSWGNTIWTFRTMYNPLELIVHTGMQDIVHTPIRSDDRYYIVNEDLTSFCRNLVRAIQSVEQHRLKKAQLRSAASAIDALLNEDLWGGPHDPTNYLRRQCDEVHETYAAYADELQGFPIQIFASYDLSAPLQDLERAQRMLRSLASHLEGKSVRIDNILPLTIGFRTADTLVFEPLDVYSTTDTKCAHFRNRLREIASGSVKCPIFYRR